MHPTRHLLAHRRLAILLCFATLLLKLLVPAGYMIGGEGGRITLELCSGVAPPPAALAMTGMHGNMPGHGQSKDHGKAEMPCAFAGLSAAALGVADPVQLAALVAFIVAATLAGIMLPALFEPAYLRPPSQAPPARF